MKVPLKLKKELAATKLLIVGEIHGVKENTSIYTSLVNSLGIKHVVLEWPVELKDIFDQFLQTGALDCDSIKGYLGDGRISQESLEEFKQLWDTGKVTAFTFFDNYEDYYTGDWNARDESYAKQILKLYPFQEKTLVITGNLHSETKSFKADFAAGELYPMGYHLQKILGKFSACTIKYYKGSFYNFGLQNFSASNPPFSETTISINAPFRYEIHLPSANPVNVTMCKSYSDFSMQRFSL